MAKMKIKEEIMLNTFMFYFLYSSSVLIYGVALNSCLQVTKKPAKLIKSFFKVFICSNIASFLTFIVQKYILAKLNLMELFPFVAVSILLILFMIFEIAFEKGIKKLSSEFIFALSIVLLSLSESAFPLQVFVTATASLLSFAILYLFIFAIRKRIEISNPFGSFSNSSLILITLSIISLITLVWNVSWLNRGVFN